MFDSLIRSLPKTLNYEIIFIDDASNDETAEWLDSIACDDIQIIHNNKNCGYAYSNNRGAGVARGDYLALLNNDLILSQNWLEPMLDAINSEEDNIGIVGNVQYRFSEQVLDHVGFKIDLNGHLEHIRDASLITRQPYFEVPAVTGACLLIRKSDFDLVGGFDESFLNGCEDIDLCFKLKKNGLSTVVTPRSRIYHHVSLSRDSDSLQQELNSRHLYSKWHGMIKGFLIEVWSKALSADDDIYKKFIDGELRTSSLVDSFGLAELISENILRRKDFYWAQLFDKKTSIFDNKISFKIQGLLPIRTIGSYLIIDTVTIEFDSQQALQNIYFCGSKINADVSPAMIFEVVVNDVQVKKFSIDRGRADFNVGISEPLLNAGQKNTIRLNVYRAINGSNSQEMIYKSLILSHIVINDQVIKNFQS